MAEPSGNRGIEYLFSDDGKCSRYVAGFLGDLSDVKDIHSQPLCVGNMVTMLRSGEPYEQMIILKGKIPALTGAPEPSWCGFPAPIYRGGHHDRPKILLPDNRTPILSHSLLSRSETGQGACQAASKNRGPNSVRGCPARPLRGRAPDCGWKGLFGDSPGLFGNRNRFPARYVVLCSCGSSPV